MKHILLLLCLVFSGISANCQNQEFTFKNSVQAEFFGHGLFYSFNYERVVLNGEKYKTTIQAGASYYPPRTGIIELWLPILINQIVSFEKHHFEFGLGYVVTNEALNTISLKPLSGEWEGFFAGRLGYRYQKPESRMIVRLGFTPLWSFNGLRQVEFHPLGGLALGYGFGR